MYIYVYIYAYIYIYNEDIFAFSFLCVGWVGMRAKRSLLLLRDIFARSRGLCAELEAVGRDASRPESVVQNQPELISEPPWTQSTLAARPQA